MFVCRRKKGHFLDIEQTRIAKGARSQTMDAVVDLMAI
jgi:hypothetical protein